MFDSVADKETDALAPVVLVAEKLPLTLSPGPAQASGSSNVAPSVNRLTVTAKAQLGPAVVEQVTVVVPTLKLEPEAGEQVTVPHPPFVVGAGYVTTAEVVEVHATWFAGHVIVQVTTVTVKLQEAGGLFGLASSTAQVTVVVPTGKFEPDAGTQVGEPTPGQLSLTVGVGNITATGLPSFEVAV